MIKNLEYKNFIWNIIGSTLNAVSSLIFLIIVTRINGVNEAGIFTYSFATACLFYSIAVYLGRPYQVTDISETFSDTDYIFNRITTIIIMLVTIFTFSLIRGYNLYKIAILFLLAFYKCIEAFSESLYAIIQKNGKLYQVGISFTLKAIGSYIIFFIIDYLFKNIILSIILVILFNIIITIFYDYVNSKKVGINASFLSKEKNIKLLKLGFFTFAFSFLSLYVLNSSRYAIDGLLSDDYQTIFGIIFMPSMVMSLLSQFVIHPYLVKIKDFIKNNDYISLNKIVTKLILVFSLLSGCFIFGCYLLGIPLLELLYGINLSAYKWEFMLIIIGAVFYGLVILISYVLIALRKTKSQFILLLIVSLLAICTSHYLVIKFKLLGASINSFFLMMIIFIIYLIILKKTIYQLKK